MDSPSTGQPKYLTSITRQPRPSFENIGDRDIFSNENMKENLFLVRVKNSKKLLDQCSNSRNK
jgi:hypothetical protein